MIKVRNKETGEYINNCYASNGILFQGRIRHDNILDKNKYEIINNNTEVIKQIEKLYKEKMKWFKNSYPANCDINWREGVTDGIKEVLKLLKDSE